MPTGSMLLEVGKHVFATLLTTQPCNVLVVANADHVSTRSWYTSTWRNKLQQMTQEKQILQQKKRLCCMEAIRTIHSN